MLSTRHKPSQKEVRLIYYPKKKLPDFSDKDVWKKLKLQCYDGTITYEDFPAAEYKYFDRLRICYLEYQCNGLSKEDAAIREKKLYSEYTENKEREKRTLQMYKEYQDNIRKAGTLRGEINRTDDKELMLRLAIECISLMTNDKVSRDFNLKKMEGN